MYLADSVCMQCSQTASRKRLNTLLAVFQVLWVPEETITRWALGQRFIHAISFGALHAAVLAGARPESLAGEVANPAEGEEPFLTAPWPARQREVSGAMQ
jgi:hypothetical protein